MKNELSSTKATWLAPTLTLGFATAVAVWITWFVTHLPWLGLLEQIATPIVLGVWTMTLVLLCSQLPRRKATSVGFGASVVCSLLGLLILGSKLAEPASPSGATSGVVPSAPLLALGFLGLGAGIGLVAGLFASFSARTDTPLQPSSHWLARFAVVACVAITPLLFIGGLVTSTNSGMAVPDWPGTFGANMFLYPLGSHSVPGVYLEHAHRLFGALIGLTILTLAIYTFAVDSRKSVRIIAVLAFVLVCIQGILGGQRVAIETMLSGDNPARADKVGRWLAMAHGVLAQLTFGVVVALAVHLSNHFRAVIGVGQLLEPKLAKRAKFVSTFLMHSLILQLIFGAMYRHLRSDHALWSHLGFSFIVMCAAMFAGFIWSSDPVRQSAIGRRLRQIGLALLVVVVIQFGLGWLAFFFGGRSINPDSNTQALVRTAHQANGAILLALSVAAFVWGRRVVKSPKPA